MWDNIGVGYSVVDSARHTEELDAPRYRSEEFTVEFSKISNLSR